MQTICKWILLCLLICSFLFTFTATAKGVDGNIEEATINCYGFKYILTDELMPRLKGLWKTADGKYKMKIENGMLAWRYGNSKWCEPEAIAVVGDKNSYDPDFFVIVNNDPAIDSVCGLTHISHQDGKLVTYEYYVERRTPPSKPLRLVFEKVKGKGGK